MFILTSLDVTSTLFWDVILYILVEHEEHFGWTFCFHLQGQRVSQATTKPSSASCLLCAWLTLLPSRWQHFVPPKYRLTSTRLHDVTSQQIVLFIDTPWETHICQDLKVTPKCWVEISVITHNLLLTIDDWVTIRFTLGSPYKCYCNTNILCFMLTGWTPVTRTWFSKWQWKLALMNQTVDLLVFYIMIAVLLFLLKPWTRVTTL